MLQDTTGTLDDLVFDVNPNTMDSPELADQKDLLLATMDGTRGVSSSMDPPGKWTFGGTARDISQLDRFQDFIDLGRNVILRDHYNQSWLIQLTDISTYTRKLAHGARYRIEYTVETVMLGALAEESES